MSGTSRPSTRAKGAAAEALACEHLKTLGYSILERNWRCRLGEIDIIARDGEYVVFVEVKARTGPSFGPGVEAVDVRKRSRLRALAEVYLQRMGLKEAGVRFDVVSVDAGPGDGPVINLIRNAF